MAERADAQLKTGTPELAGRISFTDDATRTDRLLGGNADGAAEDVLHFIEDAQGQVLEILSRWPSVISSEIRPLRPAGAQRPPGT